MPKKQSPRKQKSITIRLPPVVEKRLKAGIDAAVKRFEQGLSTIKPTLNQFVVDAIMSAVEKSMVKPVRK